MSSSNSKSLMGFIKNKIKTLSIKSILYNEIESFSYFLVKYIPTLLGFFLRNFYLSIFAKKKKGMVWIQTGVELVHINKMEFGSNVGVNTGSYLNGLGGLTLSDHVLLGSNVTISAGKHPIEGTDPVFPRPCEPSKITIEEDVWIGAGGVIVPGITLRKGTVVGANSVVTKDTEEYGVYVGAPAKLIKKRT